MARERVTSAGCTRGRRSGARKPKHTGTASPGVLPRALLAEASLGVASVPGEGRLYRKLTAAPQETMGAACVCRGWELADGAVVELCGGTW